MIHLWLTSGLLANSGAVEPPILGGFAPISAARARKKQREKNEEREEKIREQLQKEAERLAAEAFKKAEIEHVEGWRRDLDRLVTLYPLPIEIRIDISDIAASIVAQWAEMQRRKRDEEEAISLILMLA